MQRIWDISPPVAPGSPVFPGDTPYQQAWAASIAPGCPVNVSTITLSPHVGAHPLVQWEHIAHAADGLPPRVLVRTYQRMPVDQWDGALAAFAPETITRL